MDDETTDEMAASLGLEKNVASEATQKVFADFTTALERGFTASDASIGGEAEFSHEDVLLIMANLMGQAIANHACMLTRHQIVTTNVILNMGVGFRKMVETHVAMNEMETETVQ